MNVRITPRGEPQRTDLYSGIGKVLADQGFLALYRRAHPDAWPRTLPLREVAEIALDEEPGDLF